MSTSVTITGSGTPIPSAERAGPGALVRSGDVALQFDAGRSTVQRLAGCGLWPGDLTAFFATHHHCDHLTGLQDVILTRWVMDRDGEAPAFPVVVPRGPCVDFAKHILDVWQDDLAVRREHDGRTTSPDYEVIEFDYPSEPTEVWSMGEVRVFAGQVRHEPVHPAVGYRVETPDGIIAITGDTLVCDEVAALAEGADIVVYEAMRFEVIAQLPEARRFIMDYHADTKLIGGQANELGVKTLVLTHLIPEPNSEADEQLFIDDIRSGGFEGEIVVAKDLDTVTLG
jgi:ribonuclease Z